jgi:hypothetical protein
MMRWAACVALVMLAAQPAGAQDSEDTMADLSDAEVIVTAARREAEGYDDRVPVIGLRRLADFAVQEVAIVGDTRDAEKRNAEIYAMLKNAIELAERRGGIELATGELIVEPLTLANYRNLVLASDGRPDTGRASFLLKVRLTDGASAKAAVERIAAFVKNVPTVGRAEIKETDDLTLSIVAPDQYRGAVAELVAGDSRDMARRLGEGYSVEVRGLDRPIEWTRASLTEVFLYVPYSYTILSRR